MAAFVVLGSAGIVYSRDQRQPDNSRPYAAVTGRAADHWHLAVGYYICGSFVPDLPEGNDPLGIHGHGDNVAHIHPFGPSAAGKRATLAVYLDSVKANISDNRIELPGQGTRRNGDRCENGPGVIQTKVWDSRAPSDPGRIVEGDPSSIRPQDNQLMTIAFVPEGTEIPRPPSEGTLDRLTDLAPQPVATTTTIPIDPKVAATSTTVGNDPNSTTTAPGAATAITTASPTTSTGRP